MQTHFRSYSIKLLTEDTIPLQNSTLDQYHHLVCSLQYLTITRQDIAYTVNKLCQHMHQTMEGHYKLLKRLHIKGILHFGLPILPGNLTIYAYSNSD